MKRPLHETLLRWLISWGMCAPGAITHPDVTSFLMEPPARSPGVLPPRHGPERLAPLELTATEKELWDCLRGFHDGDCIPAG
jgi:hypothetical protein